MGVLDVFHAAKGAAAVFFLPGFGEGIEVVVLAEVMICGDVEAAGAGGGVLDDVVERGLHHVNHAVDEGADGEILARAGFHLAGILFQQAFVKIAESFLAGGIPVEFTDVADERGERGGFLDEGAGVGVDFLHEAGAMAAEVDEGDFVEFQPLGGAFLFEVSPAVAFGDLVLGAGFLCHLEEQDVGELGDVLVIGDAVVLEDVAEVPEFLDDVVGHEENDEW